MTRRLALVLVAALVAGGCSLIPDPRVTVDGFVFPTPAPLPDGAIHVAIDVASVPERVAPDVAFGCPAALLRPVEMVVDRSTDPPTVAFRVVETGQPIRLDWSWGVSAYDLGGEVRIIAPDGEILMSEGEVADDLGGGGSSGDQFSVCVGSSIPRGS